MIRIDLPVDEGTVRELAAGDLVEIYGTMLTGRDAAHAFLAERNRPVFRQRLQGRIIYHCGPVVREARGKYEFLSAGPTTSIREEPYQADIIRNYGLRGIMGKGGMGPKTLAACTEHGAVYLHAVGGAGALAAAAVKDVKNVYMLKEFGVPEAIWEIEVEAFPAVVTMDCRGRSLHDEVQAESKKAYTKLLAGQGSQA